MKAWEDMTDDEKADEDDRLTALEGAVEVALAPLCTDSYGFTVTIETVEPGHLRIEIAQMYEYVTVTPKFLEALAAVMGTDRIDVGDQYKTADGYDSCDYGSQYEVTFHVWTGQKPEKTT